ANPMAAAHFVQAGQPGQPPQPPSGQPFNRQPNPNVPMNARNLIDQSQGQSQNALRSLFQANMITVDQLNHAQFMNHHPHGHHPHDPNRQQAAAALQQASRQAAGQAGQFAPNPMNQNWPAHIQQQFMLKSLAANQRQFMQMFAGNGPAPGQPMPGN